MTQGVTGRAAIVGGGVIGGGWAARFLLNGWDVTVHDPAPGARAVLEEVLARARASLPALYDAALPAEGRLAFADSLEEAVAAADWVQESVPERLDLKHAVLARIDAAAPVDAVIASSTSGFKPSDLTAAGTRCIVAHPFNPVYLLPLVELVGEPGMRARAAEMLRGIGMYPLQLRREIEAHVADRFLEAVWREALWLVHDGIATTEEIDEAIRMGFGLRWAQMGLFETYRLAGGEAGMRHFLAQFGPALAWPWTKLMDVPELTDDLVETIAAQSDAQAAGRSIADLASERDANLVAILRALRRNGTAAGRVIAGHEARHVPDAPSPGPDLPVTAEQVVPVTWRRADGRLREGPLLELAERASARLLDMCGAEAAAMMPVETRLRRPDDVPVATRLVLRTRVLAAQGGAVDLMHRVEEAGGGLVATVETRLCPVGSMGALPAPVVERLLAWAAAHADLPDAVAFAPR